MCGDTRLELSLTQYHECHWHQEAGNNDENVGDIKTPACGARVIDSGFAEDDLRGKEGLTDEPVYEAGCIY